MKTWSSATALVRISCVIFTGARKWPYRAPGVAVKRAVASAGLIFPTLSGSRAELVCGGILRIDEMRDPFPPVQLVADRLPRRVLEQQYGINLPLSLDDDPLTPVKAHVLTENLGMARGFMTAQGRADDSRAARLILKDYINGRLLYAHPPPDKRLRPDIGASRVDAAQDIADAMAQGLAPAGRSKEVIYASKTPIDGSGNRRRKGRRGHDEQDACGTISAPHAAPATPPRHADGCGMQVAGDDRWAPTGGTDTGAAGHAGHAHRRQPGWRRDGFHARDITSRRSVGPDKCIRFRAFWRLKSIFRYASITLPARRLLRLLIAPRRPAQQRRARAATVPGQRRARRPSTQWRIRPYINFLNAHHSHTVDQRDRWPGLSSRRRCAANACNPVVQKPTPSTPCSRASAFLSSPGPSVAALFHHAPHTATT